MFAHYLCVLIAVSTIRGDGGRNVGTTGPPPEFEEVQPVTTEPTIDQQRRPIGTVPPATPKPPPIEGCALSPNPEVDSEKFVGFRFGTQQDSRLEFATTRGKFKKNLDLRFDFRTKEPEGILFYVSHRTHKQYAAVYLLEGHVVFSFKGEGNPVTIKSNKVYNDDAWHMVELNREPSFSKLVVDESDLSDSSQKVTALDVSVPFYFGGISPDSYNQVQANLNTTASFNGCIRGISMNNKPLEQSSEYGTIPCSDNVEVGTYFAGDPGSYIKLRERFKVGVELSIQMDIKPRTDSGLLVAVHGRKDYYVLELFKGELKLTVENGRGPVTTIFRPKNTYHLCDGQWHNIQAVKSKNVITLSVDNVFTDPKIGPSHSTSTDTGSALFLGGHRFLSKVRGISSRVPFVGCIKNMVLNKEPITLATNQMVGNFTSGYCPTN